MHKYAEKDNARIQAKVEFLEKNIESIQEILTQLFGHCESTEYLKLMNRHDARTGMFIQANKIKKVEVVTKVLQYKSFSDLMISMNSFYDNEKATFSNLKTIRAFALDIDYKRNLALSKLKPQQVVGLLQEEVFGYEIPYPTMIEIGHQVRLIYLLQEPIFNAKKCKTMTTALKRVISVFSERLEGFGCEPQKLNSFIRFPLSINTKDDSTVTFVSYGKKVDIYELFEYMPDLPDWYDEWKAKQLVERSQNGHIAIKKVSCINGRVTMLKSRMDDLVTLQNYFNEYDNGGIGHREILCFLYRNFAMQLYDDFQTAKKEMLKFNEGFKIPHAEHNVISKTNSCTLHISTNKKGDTWVGYKYNDKTLRELFGEQLCDELGVFGGMSNAERQKRFKARKKVERLKNGETKAQQIEHIKSAIVELRKQGMKYKEVSEKLEIPIDSVKRHIKALKKENRL